MYWAGPRCFVATMRSYDFQVIQLLKEKYDWEVYYPLKLVGEALKSSKNLPVFGKNGILRKTCFEYIDKSDLVVAYTGLIWDTGTAREIEYAVSKVKPVLAWSDSSVIVGETLGRKVVLNGKDVDSLYVKALPFNGMDVVFDRYLEISELYTDGIDEHELSKKINEEARKLLQEIASE
jgi:nucleoside 2-deoxyribosyltransferase